MTENLSVDAEGILGYGTLAAGMATQLAAAAGQVAGASPVLLGPVFGLIGGDFVAAYAAVSGTHFDNIAKLATTVGSMATAAGTSVVGYTGVDANTAGALGNAGTGLA